jgi:thiol-disulfide isomerase/thioredoxin
MALGLALAACGQATANQANSTTQAATAPAAATTAGDSAVPATLPPEAAMLNPDLRDFGVAPELNNTVWLNTPAPLKLANLRGQVVLIDMWTFDCINCQHVIPSLKQWYDTYRQQGLVVIGNHFPEFGYEADLNNLKKAVGQYGIRYPVAQDNDGQTWTAYNTHYWPTLFLVDKQGHIRYEHIGEGAYDVTEGVIQSLLREPYP